jgi:hypothetical protein
MGLSYGAYQSYRAMVAKNRGPEQLDQCEIERIAVTQATQVRQVIQKLLHGSILALLARCLRYQIHSCLRMLCGR